MSLPSQIIKDIRVLHTAKGRKAANLCIAEGERTVFTLINAGWKPAHIYTVEDTYLLTNGFTPSSPCTMVSTSIMERISPSSTPSGILAVFPIPPTPLVSQLGAGLVLAQVADPGNMGTLIRSCTAFGYRSVVVVAGCDPFSPKVIQATAGAIAHVTLFRWTWAELLAHKGDLSLCALVAQGGKRPEEVPLSKTLLVVGNEAHGIYAPWIADCDAAMTLPMHGQIESLNAAVAGSIALYIGSLN